MGFYSVLLRVIGHTVSLLIVATPVLGQEEPATQEEAPQEEAPQEEEKPAPDAPRRLQFSGDTRIRLSSDDTDLRDGSEDEGSEARLRLRGGVAWLISDNFDLKARVATSVSSEDNDYEFKMELSAPRPGGLTPGQATFDEFFLRWTPARSFQLYVGRFQTEFQLKGVFPKSLDFKNSNNMRINWTDGAHMVFRWKGGWVSHAIFQYQDPDGPTNLLRAPLYFADSDSRVSYFLNLRNNRRIGSIVQQGIDVSYLPSSLLKDGTILAGRVEDYWAAVGRMSFEWHLSEESPTSILAGAAVGYAPETPTELAVQVPGIEDSDGYAVQLQASLMNFKPGHSIGINYGRAGAGWLISPQYAPNQELGEIRYRKLLRRGGLFEARVRYRQDLEREVGSQKLQSAWDAFMRFTRHF